MPIATGKPKRASAAEMKPITVVTTASVPRVARQIVRTSCTTTKAPAASTSHLICWRSSGSPDRNRTTSEAAAAASSAMETTLRPFSVPMNTSRRKDSPSGFGYVRDTPPGAGRAMSRGVTTVAIRVMPERTAAMTTTGRQRGDGRRPVGNNSTTAARARTTGTKSTSEERPTMSAAARPPRANPITA